MSDLPVCLSCDTPGNTDVVQTTSDSLLLTRETCLLLRICLLRGVGNAVSLGLATGARYSLRFGRSCTPATSALHGRCTVRKSAYRRCKSGHIMRYIHCRVAGWAFLHCFRPQKGNREEARCIHQLVSSNRLHTSASPMCSAVRCGIYSSARSLVFWSPRT